MPLSHNLLKPLGVSTQTKKDTFSEGKKIANYIKTATGIWPQEVLKSERACVCTTGT